MDSAKTKFRRTWMFLFKLLGFGSTVVTFALVWTYFYPETGFFNLGNYLTVVLYGCILMLFNHVYGVYKFGHSSTPDLFGSGVMALLITNVITYIQLSLINRAFLVPFDLLLGMLVQMVALLITTFISNRMYFVFYPARDIIAVVSEYYYSQPLLQKFLLTPKKFSINEIVSTQTDVEDICRSISGYSSVLLCDVEDDVRNKIVNYCFKTDRRIYIMPSISDIVLSGADIIQVSDAQLFLCKNRGLTTEQRIIKRLIDIVLSLIGIIITSPIFLITVIAIKLGDRGPVFYKQRRVTEKGRIFNILKFRSMIVDAEKENGVQLSTVGDSRITKVGHIIRKFRVDELPQLINILFGDMAIVGPRPERPEIYDEYAKILPDFVLRLKAKAGLTGYAQVFGKYNTSANDKLIMDLIYSQSYSILQDLKLIFLTLKIIFKRESTEAVDESYNSSIKLKAEQQDG